jgi:hypothetical protein
MESLFIAFQVDLQATVLTYDVPELSADGTCSAARGVYHKFSLAEELFGCSPEEAVRKHPKSVELVGRLGMLVQHVARKNGIEWLGLYHRVRKEGYDTHHLHVYKAVRTIYAKLLMLVLPLEQSSP